MQGIRFVPRLYFQLIVPRLRHDQRGQTNYQKPTKQFRYSFQSANSQSKHNDGKIHQGFLPPDKRLQATENLCAEVCHRITFRLQGAKTDEIDHPKPEQSEQRFCWRRSGVDKYARSRIFSL